MRGMVIDASGVSHLRILSLARFRDPGPRDTELYLESSSLRASDEKIAQNKRDETHVERHELTLKTHLSRFRRVLGEDSLSPFTPFAIVVYSTGYTPFQVAKRTAQSRRVRDSVPLTRADKTHN